jgi:hypothetical protein
MVMSYENGTMLLARLGYLPLLPFFTLAFVGCGRTSSGALMRSDSGSDSSKSNGDVGPGSTVDGDLGNGSEAMPVVCPDPGCFAGVLACLGEGACRQQTTDMCGQEPCVIDASWPQKRIKQTCWDNGVKVQDVTDFSNPSTVYTSITARKDGADCYSMTGSDEPRAGSYYLVDEAGKGRIAVYTIDPATGGWSIACREGANVDLPSRCHPGSDFVNRDSRCVPGPCAWD